VYILHCGVPTRKRNSTARKRGFVGSSARLVVLAYIIGVPLY
jgi:hypothetical protein